MTEPRRYLITGGTSGIGKMCAKYMTQQGSRVWITGTSRASVEAALEDGVAVDGTPCDVTVQREVDQAFAQGATALGGLDGAFLNAGIDGQGLTAATVDAAAFGVVLDVNVVGILRCAQAAYRTLARPATLVVNTSVNALRPEQHFVDYNASKAAALSVAQSLALDWSAEGLTVIALAPGYFPSRMTEPYLNDAETAAALLKRLPIGRFGQPEEIGATVAFLLSNAAPFLTGACIPIAGGSNI